MAIASLDSIKGGQSVNLVVAKPELEDMATNQDDTIDEDGVLDVLMSEAELKAYRRKQLWQSLVISGAAVILFILLVKYKIIKL